MSCRRHAARRLVVWDVDNVLVDGSLHEVVEKLLPPDRLHSLKQLSLSSGWTNCTYISTVAKELAKCQIGRCSIECAVRSLPTRHLMVDAVRQIHKERVAQVILSASNIALICTLLDFHCIRDHFGVIHANEGTWVASGDQELLQVQPLLSGRYGSQCSCNWRWSGLCKGLALTKISELMDKEPWIVYFGHSTEDICALQRLRRGDYVFCLGGKLATPVVEKAAGAELRTLAYRTGEDVVCTLRQVPSAIASNSPENFAARPETRFSFLKDGRHCTEDLQICSRLPKPSSFAGGR